MKILITNDDGISAEGIIALYNILALHHDVYVIAPESERSGSSNAFTSNVPLRIKKVSDNQWSLSGYPSDCVILGLQGSIIPEIDCVISGINHGPNIGDDIYFSGTVGAARTACIFGKPAIAVSMNKYHQTSAFFGDASYFISELLEVLKQDNNAGYQDMISEDYFYNVNYPDLPKNHIRGSKIVVCGKRHYINHFYRTTIEKDSEIINIKGDLDFFRLSNSDGHELERDYITISPIRRDCTDYSFFNVKHDMRTAVLQSIQTRIETIQF